MRLKSAKRPSCKHSRSSKWGLCGECRKENNAPANRKGGIDKRAELAEATRKNKIKM
jgi:hypothetical protein